MNDTDHILDIKHRISKWWSGMDNDNLSLEEDTRICFIHIHFGGRNCYEFLRLNLPSALPHITNLELLIRNQESKVIECAFRFNLLKEYSRSTSCNYIFVAEDATRSISCIDYDVVSSRFGDYVAMYNDQLDIKVPDKWSWFFMNQQQIFLFMQDPIHIATKIRNRLLSKLANLKMGDFSIDTKYLVELIKTKSKIEHNLMKSDLNPKDRQNFASCLRISSELVLDLINRNENAK
ncbi:unnamed protein product, partial [Rotaria socialis]